MRVDWSQNLVTGYNSIFTLEEWSGKLNSEPVPVFVNSPNDPNAPFFQYEGQGGDRKLTYFDVVNQAVLHPETTSLTFSDGESFNNIPVCYPRRGRDRIALRRRSPCASRSAASTRIATTSRPA